MGKVFSALILTVLSLSLSTALAGGQGEEGKEKVLVVVSHPLLAGMVRAVGGPFVSVSSLVPQGVDPHEYELGVEDLKKASAADLVLVDVLGHIPASDRIYELHKEKGVVLLEEVEKRGWRPGTLQGGSPLYHEFFLDREALILSLKVISERLSKAFEARNRSDAAQRILGRGDALEEAVASSFARAQEILKSVGMPIALYSPSLLYLIRSLGINVSAIATPDPEAEPLPRALENLGASAPACLVLAPTLEHVDPGKLRGSLGRRVEIVDVSQALNAFERGGVASFPMEVAISIKAACLGGLGEASAGGAEAPQGLPTAIPWFLAGLILGVSAAAAYVMIRRRGAG